MTEGAKIFAMMNPSCCSSVYCMNCHTWHKPGLEECPAASQRSATRCRDLLQKLVDAMGHQTEPLCEYVKHDKFAYCTCGAWARAAEARKNAVAYLRERG